MTKPVDKDSLPLDKPRRTPGHPTKSHIVKTKVDGREKIIRFGEQGAETAGKPKAGESDRMKQKRASFKARHAKNIAKGKSSPAYWANKVKWAEGGAVKMAAGGAMRMPRVEGAALQLIEQMRRAGGQEEFNPVLASMRDQRRASRRPQMPTQTRQAPRAATPTARREEPLPLPPMPPAMRPDENPPPEASANPMRFDEGNPHVATAISMAQRYNLPPSVFLSLVQQESRFDPNARSPRGAIGLGQLMPGTARELGVDPRDPVQNLEGSARYLRQMLDRFGSMELALAAYNAGPGTVRRAGNVIPNIRETQNYVPSILRRAGASVPERGLADLEQKYAEGGVVRAYDPDEIERIAASVAEPEGYAEGGRVGRVADMLARAFREGLSPRTRQNPRGLPMDEESRRLRAESLGFDLDNPTYHGTSADADFRAFRQKDRGVWSTRNPKIASEYAQSNDSQGVDRNTASRVIPLVSRAENVRTPSDVDMETMRMSPNYARAQAEVFRRMRAQGADAVNMGGGVRVDLDTRNLRSPHATFDPERVREADILAGLAALGVGIGANLEDLEQKYAEGGAVMSDEEYDRRLLSRMKAQTGRVTEPTRAEQMQALRNAGTSAAEGLAEVLLPQSPLDVALMVAMGPGGRAARLAGAGALAALEPSEAEASGLRRLIRAYHGSPHKFDEFDIRKIGTGEGAQAYGRGLYFAENEDVARQYRNNLAPGLLNPDGTNLRVPAQEDARWAYDMLRSNHGDYDRAISQVAPKPTWTPKAREENQRVVDILESWRNSGVRPAGHMYEVDLHAGPREFLNWDEPLSRQSREVQESLQRFGLRADPDAARAYDDALLDALYGDPNRALPPQPRDPTGADIYQRVLRMDPEEARVALMQAGIPGTRYLDAGSRGVGGTYNYAVFDPDIIDITRRYAQGGLAELDQKYANGGIVATGPAKYDPDAVDALVKQIEAEYV